MLAEMLAKQEAELQLLWMGRVCEVLSSLLLNTVAGELPKENSKQTAHYEVRPPASLNVHLLEVGCKTTLLPPEIHTVPKRAALAEGVEEGSLRRLPEVLVSSHVYELVYGKILRNQDQLHNDQAHDPGKCRTVDYDQQGQSWMLRHKK